MKKRISNFVKTVIVSAMYASSLFIATGLPQAAMAVTCNDVIQGTSIKYSDALVGFVYDGTKTYAISKSAITGSFSLPDAFFAFSSGIDRGYQYDGLDTASLKLLVISGKYGEARPVFIDSKAKQDFITKQFLQYLGSAGSAKSTYINAWKEFGANQQFTDIAGAALPYTNWTGGVTPDTSTITAPQAVTMGSDGVWLNGENAQRISQVVEFDGKLDCAMDLSSLATITPPVPPVLPPTDPNAIQGLICTQDLNLDGQIASNELQNCIKTPQGEFCPVGSLDCTATFQDAVCPAGTTLNTTRDMCQATAQNVCGSGYTWDSGIDKCIATVVCPENGTFNPVADRCEKLVQNDCPVGYTYDANPASQTYDRCVKSATCTDGGAFIAAKDRCEKTWMPVCDTANGYAYNGTTGKCERSPICTYGSYNATYNLCVQPFVPSCPSGYSYNSSRGRCEKAPECPAGTTYNVVTNKCDAISNASSQQMLACSPKSFLCASYADPCCNVSISCPNGPQGQVNVAANYCCLGSDAITIQSPLNLLTRTELTSTGYALSALQCDSVGNCSYYFMDRYCSDGSPASAWMLSGSFTMASTQMVCPAGQALINGNQCLSATNPTCSGGNFDLNMDVCWAAYTPTCTQGTYDSASGLCILAPSCPNGTLNTTTDLCEATITRDCGSYSFDAAANLCFSSPVCANGAYDASLNVCQATLTRNCGTYSWNQADFKCLQPVTCPKDAAFSLADSTTFSTTLDKCVSEVQHDCPAGTTYTPLSIGKCEAVPICNNDAVRYDTTAHACYVGDNTCPLGSQYSCMSYNNNMQCSANSCFDQSNPAGGEVFTKIDESMYQDDARNPDGSCNGQIMIFAGKPSRCRPPGLKVGYINNCCESDEVMSEDVGNKAQTAISAIKTMYEVGQVAYYSYAASTGAATVSAGAAAGTVTVTSVATGATTTLSGAVASGVTAGASAGAAGATTAGTMMASMQAYATALLNPATIAIAIVIMVVMKVLMGSGCDATDIQTGGQVESKQCHYLGDYCERKWPVFGCVQKAKGYCCFNSMMARIIHEQGRPQLTTFGADGAWGSPSAPNCRGFVPGEFESLDFAKIDMSEYFDVLQKDMATKIQNAQDQINNTIQQRTQQIQSGI